MWRLRLRHTRFCGVGGLDWPMLRRSLFLAAALLWTEIQQTILLAPIRLTFSTSGNSFNFGSTAANNVPDGGATVMLLGAALSAMGLLRKKTDRLIRQRHFRVFSSGQGFVSLPCFFAA